MKVNVHCYLKYVFPLSLVFFLLSCGSRVPIAPVEKAIVDDRLVGAWWATDSAASESIELIIYKFNEKEYFLEMREEKQNYNQTERDTLHLRTYVTEIQKKRFINAQMIETLEPDDRRYFFFRYDFEPNDRLIVRPLEDVGNVRIDDFKDSKSLYNYIKQQIDNDSLYGESSSFIRRK